MPRISLEFDQLTLEKIEKVARQDNISIPAWVRNRIKKILKTDRQEDFLNLFGAIKDDTFVEPDEIDSKYDIPNDDPSFKKHSFFLVCPV
jgi:hypothetical protein